MNEQIILSVDDNEDDNFLLRRAFLKNAGGEIPLKIVNDGQEAIRYLDETRNGGGPDCPMPALLLLDLKMPRQDGFAVLEWIHRHPDLKNLPVAVFTSSQRDDDIQRAYQAGAEWYLVKPVALDDLMRLTRDAAQWLATRDPQCLARSPFYRAPHGAADSLAVT